eukprot:118010-Prymnesium_polylepis.3
MLALPPRPLCAHCNHGRQTFLSQDNCQLSSSQDAICGGWSPPTSVCLPGGVCLSNCVSALRCTYCSARTVCSSAYRGPIYFRYYLTNVTSIEPAGGFVDGGTMVTLHGQGFLDFNGQVRLARTWDASVSVPPPSDAINNTLVAFEDIRQQALELTATSIVVMAPTLVKPLNETEALLDTPRSPPPLPDVPPPLPPSDPFVALASNETLAPPPLVPPMPPEEPPPPPLPPPFAPIVGSSAAELAMIGDDPELNTTRR